MTLCAAWVRRGKSSNELVIASDSRLSGGETWDGCPKILALPRSDAAICFAGSTLRAYPLMIQLISAIDSFPESRKRISDFNDLHGHAVRIFNGMLDKIRLPDDDAEGELARELAESQFLLAGFSWRQSQYRIVRISYDSKLRAYVSHRFRTTPTRVCVFIGGSADAANIPNIAKNKLNAMLYKRSKLPNGKLDWEPFEVLRDMICGGEYHSIGGPPQVVKVYRHMNCQPFAVYWPSRDKGQLTMSGREMLGYERTDWPCLDAETLEVSGISLES